MLKGYYKTILFSLLVHIAIFYLLSLTTTVPSISHKASPQAIKSFLYVPPQQESNIEQKKADSKTQATEQKETEPSVTIQEEIPKNIIAEKSTEFEELPKKVPEKTTAKSIDNNSQSSQTGQLPRNFSAFGQLNKLQNKLKNKIIEQESYRYSQKKSASVLDGTPNLVPHSTKQLNDDEIKENNSQQISSDILITKGDDGRCTIERDLTAVGIEGVKSVEGFNCGKSKFDKSFQEHMKKVLKKLGK